MRITQELIVGSPSFYNPLKDRELDLRGMCFSANKRFFVHPHILFLMCVDKKIPAIENLGVTQDQYDTIDFSNNAISRLESFPLLKRLKTLFFCNNRIYYIAPNIGNSLPNLEELVLTSNQLTNLTDLHTLATLPKLRKLSLLDNTVTKRQHYRLYVIHKVPQLKVLDFKKISPKVCVHDIKLYW